MICELSFGGGKGEVRTFISGVRLVKMFTVPSTSGDQQLGHASQIAPRETKENISSALHGHSN